MLWFHFLRLAKVQVFLSLGFMSKPQENDVTTRPLLLLTAAVPVPGPTWLASNPVKLPALFIFLHLQSGFDQAWDRVCGFAAVADTEKDVVIWAK